MTDDALGLAAKYFSYHRPKKKLFYAFPVSHTTILITESRQERFLRY
jgi:hypothetical protein